MPGIKIAVNNRSRMDVDCASGRQWEVRWIIGVNASMASDEEKWEAKHMFKLHR